MNRCALISVTDKTGVVAFAQGLKDLGFSILSTGGTYRVIEDGGVEVREVADYTGFPEMMDGRLKTLHPKVHGGILARRGEDGDRTAMEEYGIDAIDVVAVNLYPFRETVRKEGVTRAEVVENIDIGGPTMIRSAAKNHDHVAVVVDPGDYDPVLSALRSHDGELPVEMRRDLASKAFAHTASYDTAIGGWFAEEQRAREGQPRFGAYFALSGKKLQGLRYGENPHQSAAFYCNPDASGPGLATARQLSGKELSYNNILDLDAAMGIAFDFTAPTCVIVKHNNPCGVASGEDSGRVFSAALEGDPVSAFGGIVALNVPVTADVAETMAREAGFLEAIIAPGVDAAALEILKDSKWGRNVRVMDLDGRPPDGEQVSLRQVSGGFLLQTFQPGYLKDKDEVVTTKNPSAEERGALEFAMRVCKHVKSNAILLARFHSDGTYATVGVGAGQMSRVDAVKIAVEKAGDLAKGAVLASDAFFPFADGLEAAATAGVTAVIQPGGSKRDDEVVAAADKAGIAMVFTGARHFRH